MAPYLQRILSSAQISPSKVNALVKARRLYAVDFERLVIRFLKKALGF